MVEEVAKAKATADEYRYPDLQNSGNEKDHGPQARSRQSYDEKTNCSQHGLNECYPENARGNAADGGTNQVLELSAALAKKAVGKRARYFCGALGLRQQCSRNENRKEELQHGQADAGRRRK